MKIPGQNNISGVLPAFNNSLIKALRYSLLSGKRIELIGLRPKTRYESSAAPEGRPGGGPVSLTRYHLKNSSYRIFPGSGITGSFNLFRIYN
jgi:hypothetical protein